MESTRYTPSVIEKLMGLDHPPQQPDLKRQRVLSENYLKKSNMIGMHETSVFYSGIPSSIAISERKEIQDRFHQEMPKFDSTRFWSNMDRNVDLSENRVVYSKTECPSTEHSLITEKLHLEELVNLPQDLNCDAVLGYIQHSELHPKNLLQIQPFDELPGHSDYHRAETFLSNVKDRKCNTYSNSSEAIIPRNDLRSLQTFNKDSPSSCFGKFGIYSSLKLLKSRTYSKVNISLPPRVVLRPSSGMKSDSVQCTSLTRIATPAQSKNGRQDKIGKNYGEMENISLTLFPKIVDRSIYVEKLLSKRETILRFSSFKGTSDAKVGRNTHSFVNGSSLSRLDGKQIFDKWRKNKTSETNKLSDIICDVGEIYRPMLRNELENVKSCNQSSQQDQKLQSGNSFCISNTVLKGCSSTFDKFCPEEPDLFSSPNLEKESINGHVICRVSSSCDLDSDSDIKLPLIGGQVIHHEKECRLAKDEMLDDSLLIESIPPCISETTVTDHQHNDIPVSPSEFKELLSGTLMKLNSPWKVWESSSKKTSPYYFDEPRIDPAFSRKSRVVNRKSPNSVLEPHLPKENTPVSKVFESENGDYDGLAMQVQWLNSKSEETYSEGNGLAVSSDEDSEEVSCHLSEDTKKILGRYGAEDNKNFSYMLDILEKAELACINPEHYLRAWNSSEYLVDPSVFQLLEFKYGKQTSWAKSERKLLFDRVNVGLKEILNIRIGICTFEKSLRRRFTAALGRSEVEEELRMFLTSEEKDSCEDLSDKILDEEMKWLQLSEDVQTICKDIENVLFAELVGEIVYIPCL